MLTLYGIKLSTFTRKVRLALAEKGLEYRLEVAPMGSPKVRARPETAARAPSGSETMTPASRRSSGDNAYASSPELGAVSTMSVRSIPLAIAILIWAAAPAQQAPDAHAEMVIPIPAWNAEMVEVRSCRPDSDVCHTDLFIAGPGAKRRQLASRLIGPFLALPMSRAVFACESNAVMGATAPVLIELSGKQFQLKSHPGYLRECASVGTGEETMLIYSLADSGRPLSLVRVFSSTGEVLVEQRFEAEGEIRFLVSGKEYQAHVPAPEWPG